MNPIEKLTELLSGKFFKHNNKDYSFVSCKQVYGNIMILTNSETLQIPVDRFVDFYQKVEGNCYVPTSLPVKKTTVSEAIPMKNEVKIVPEMPKVFEKLNTSFESLIESLETATAENIGFLEAKTKMITSIAQTAVNVENSKNYLIKMLNK